MSSMSLATTELHPMVLDLNKERVLVIMGRAGSGKDTFSRMVREFIYGTARQNMFHIRFSDPLKDICCELFDWNRSRIDDLEYKEELLETPFGTDDCGITLRTRREVLQHVGQVFRAMDEDVWAKRAMQTAGGSFGMSDGFISTDCRFKNEQRILAGNFGETLFVKLHLTGAAPSIKSKNDTSETSIDDLYSDMEFFVEYGDLDTLREYARVVGQFFFRSVGST